MPFDVTILTLKSDNDEKHDNVYWRIGIITLMIPIKRNSLDSQQIVLGLIMLDISTVDLLCETHNL